MSSGTAQRQRFEPSGLEDWRSILEDLGVPYREMQATAKRAKLAGVPFQIELMASGTLDERELFRALACYLSVEFMERVEPKSLFLRERHSFEALRRPGGAQMALALDGTGQTVLLIAPDRIDIAAMSSFLKRHARFASHIRMVPPSQLRQAMQASSRELLLRTAVNGLFERMPKLSARFVLNAWQGVVLGAFTVLFGAGLLFAPTVALLALHGALSALFLGCVALRMLVSQTMPDSPRAPLATALRTDEMPVYTVLVALYKEAEIVPELLTSLGRLVWPRSKLEIKLICESDDRETIDAIRSQNLRSYISIVEVPPGGPRTKPKALSYALPMTRGEFLVLYDAEDRPHPFQLVEAWQQFRQSGEDLACLQAPLVISNRNESWISAMFGFEYSALFKGILPWLARRRLVLPLGGTSNHFRRDILESVGAAGILTM